MVVNVLQPLKFVNNNNNCIGFRSNVVIVMITYFARVDRLEREESFTSNK